MDRRDHDQRFHVFPNKKKRALPSGLPWIFLASALRDDVALNSLSFGLNHLPSSLSCGESTYVARRDFFYMSAGENHDCYLVPERSGMIPCAEILNSGSLRSLAGRKNTQSNTFERTLIRGTQQFHLIQLENGKILSCLYLRTRCTGRGTEQ